MGPGNTHSSAQQALRQAREHLNHGRAQQAEALIRQVLNIQADNHEALNLLGVIALNANHTPQAVELFARAIQLHGAEAEYHCNLGVALLNANRANDGEAALLAALKRKPAHPMANLNLGLRDLQAGRFDDARQRLEKAVKKMPTNAIALNALGVAHSKCGKPAKAAQLFRTVLKAHPEHLDAQINLASALVDMDEADKAIALYTRLIEKHPGQMRLHFNHGVALRKAKRDLDAIDAYERALAIEPRFADAHLNVSTIYANRGHHDAALEHVKAAAALKPNDIHIMTNKARALRDAGLKTEALTACERIDALAPGNADALGIRMTVLQNDGDFASARDIATRALTANPELIPVLLALSQDKDYAFSDAQIQSLENAASDVSTDAASATRAWFALAKVHHDRDDHTSAFDSYKRGNTLRDESFAWTKTDEQALFTALTYTFTAAFFKAAPIIGNDSERPVFIVGMPRSGTTLVEQIVASHPSAEGGGELPDIQVMADTLQRTLGSAAPYPACVTELDAAKADMLATRYLERLTRVSDTAERVTNKMPDNYQHLGFIARLLPKARVIYCRRDPMANCFSIYQQNFEGFHPYAYDLEKLARRYRNHERLMDHWRKVLPLPILEVAYEDMVADQEGQSRRIMEFCNLDWNPRVLDFHETARNVQTASLWQVRQPIYTGALKGWRAYEAFLDPLKKSLDSA